MLKFGCFGSCRQLRSECSFSPAGKWGMTALQFVYNLHIAQPTITNILDHIQNEITEIYFQKILKQIKRD
jgi:hypothetical protein